MNIEIERVKISVTVPVPNVTEVRNAMCEAGAGVIGNYDYCSNSCKVTGTFRPNEEANPYIGSKNKMEYVDEEKLEVVCDIDKVKSVVSAIRNIHPYEEPSIEIIPLLEIADLYSFGDTID